MAGEGVAVVEVALARVFLRLLVGVVTGADERGAFDDTEAQLQADVAPVSELVRCHPAVHGQMLRRGLEVLADGEDIHAVGDEVAQALLDLVGAFAEAEHEAGFCGEAAGLGVAEYAAGAVIPGLHAHGLLQAVTSLGGESRTLYTIPGIVPPGGEWPTGCRFSDRCGRRMDRCSLSMPALTEIAPGHLCRCFLHSDAVEAAKEVVA